MSEPWMDEISAGVMLSVLEDEHFARALQGYCASRQDQYLNDLRSAARDGDAPAAKVAEAMLTFAEDLPKSMRSLAKQYAVR